MFDSVAWAPTCGSGCSRACAAAIRVDARPMETFSVSRLKRATPKLSGKNPTFFVESVREYLNDLSVRSLVGLVAPSVALLEPFLSCRRALDKRSRRVSRSNSNCIVCIG